MTNAEYHVLYSEHHPTLPIWVKLEEWVRTDNYEARFIVFEEVDKKITVDVAMNGKAGSVRYAITRFDALVAEYGKQNDYPPHEPGALADDTEAVDKWRNGGYAETEITQAEDDFPF